MSRFRFDSRITHSKLLIIIQFILSVANVCLSLGGGSNFRDVNCGQRYCWLFKTNVVLKIKISKFYSKHHIAPVFLSPQHKRCLYHIQKGKEREALG